MCSTSSASISPLVNIACDTDGATDGRVYGLFALSTCPAGRQVLPQGFVHQRGNPSERTAPHGVMIEPYRLPTDILGSMPSVFVPFQAAEMRSITGRGLWRACQMS
jgi:hypothetical protein